MWFVLATPPHTPSRNTQPRHNPSKPCASLSVHREGPGLRTLRLSVDDLRTRFRQHTVTAALQCAGNKRDAFNAFKEVKGLAWDVGAIGNATWTGVLLRDVLLEAGMKEEDLRGVQHVQFEGADADMEGAAYGASIPVHKVHMLTCMIPCTYYNIPVSLSLCICMPMCLCVFAEPPC